MLRYKTETRPGLVALYDIRPGNGAGQFLQPRSPHGAPIQVKFFKGFGVNKGQISIFHFITQKGTSLRDFASFEPLSVKIRQGVSSLRWSEKK